MEQSPEQKPMILQKPPGYRDPNNPQKPLPPRKPPLPPSFRPKPKKHHCCRICCCTICIIILILIFLFILIAAFIYIFYKPSLPEFNLGSFRVSNFTITLNNNNNNAYLDASTISTVKVKNKNEKIAWRFEQSSVKITADNGDLNLGSTKVAAFDVKVKNATELKVATNVKDEEIDEKQKRRLKSMFDSKALVPSVEVRTKTGVKVHGWKSMMIDVNVVCGDVTLRQIQNGDAPRCSFTIFNRIKIK